MILEQLDILNKKEKHEATTATYEMFSSYIKRDIDCMGCGIHLQKFLSELTNFVKNKNKAIYLQDITINVDNKICIKESYLDNNYQIAAILQKNKNNASQIQEINKQLMLKKKTDISSLSQKKNYRCLLHSKKPIPAYLWKNETV